MKILLLFNAHLSKVLAVLLLLVGFVGSGYGAVFTVTNINDSGAGSLRQAILDSNASSGADTISFNINSGIQMIRPLTPLPAVTEPTIVDGSTQLGFSGTPLIAIDGTSVSGNGDVFGLRISGGNSVIKNLAIINFRNPAPQAIRIDTNDGNTVQGCYIGVDPNGTTARGNYSGIIIASSNNLIGGTTAGERNVIANSSFDNINIVGAGSNNRIQGNFVGTNASGTAALSNSFGISVFSSGSGNVIGGTAPGAGNLISGHSNFGISAGSANTSIQGNLIGTDVTGTLAFQNQGTGVSVAATSILIGGNTAAARNIISGNSIGISVSLGDGPIRLNIKGNYIGVDITGRRALPNSFGGINSNGAVMIGGTESGAGNIISGNNGAAISLNNSSSVGSIVQGNFIGTDVTGSVALGNNGAGFNISSSNNLIGGTTAAARNIISGNNAGIDIGSGTTAQLSNNVIQGNFIGTDITGTLPIPNRGFAVSITGSNTLIGGTVEGAGNIIAYNGGVGVRIASTFGGGIGNSIRRNSFFMNGGLAIDLGASNVTPNDGCDGDSGPNNLQNYPVLTSAVSDGTIVLITASLNSVANSQFSIDFFSSPTYDPANYGEGKNYLGSGSISTSGDCNGEFVLILPYRIAGGQFITATATDSNGNTSEFSQYVRVSGNSIKPNFDFDGDGRADVSVFRPSNGSWYVQQSQNGFTGLQFGFSTDKLVPADYDGDGKTDVAVYRGGTWYLQRSQLGFTGIQFGDGGDIPVPADYDGDGKAELAVFRPSNGYWYLLNLTTNQFTATPFGQAGDKPVPADYDGDGKADIAVNRTGNWYIQRSQLGFTGVLFGDSNDKLVPADYDGDGKADIAVFRPSNGVWYLLQSTAGFACITFGLGTDIPVAADYDGDGKADLAVVRNGIWYLNRTTQGFTGVQFGNSTDLSIPNSFVR